MKKSLLFLAVLAALVAPVLQPCAWAEASSDPEYLVIKYRVESVNRISYDGQFFDHTAARAAAVKVALCGFWRTDLVTHETRLVAPGAVEEVAFMTPQETPPVGAPELPDVDVESVVDCPSARMLR